MLPRDDVGVAVAVPIAADRRRQRAALQRVGLLLKVPRRQELRRAIGAELAGVLDERNAAVFVADDQDRSRRRGPNRTRPARSSPDPSRSGSPSGVVTRTPAAYFGSRPRADVFEVREAIEKFAARADRDRRRRRSPRSSATGSRRRRAACRRRRSLAASRNCGSSVVPSLRKQEDEAVQRAVRPFAVGVQGVVPTVVAPVFHRRRRGRARRRRRSRHSAIGDAAIFGPFGACPSGL